MQNKTNRFIRVVAATAALSFTALQLSAQQGTFNLPVEAHWGQAVLSPGAHRVSVPNSAGQKVVFLEGEKTATQMSVPMMTQPSAEKASYIHLVKIGGTYYVDAYQSGYGGNKYFFSKPKSTRTVGPVEEESTIINVASR